MKIEINNVNAMPGLKPVHPEYSSLLLMLLFIFLKVRAREC